MLGKRGNLWPARLSCDHLCLVTDTGINVGAALCRICPREPLWPIRVIAEILELRAL